MQVWEKTPGNEQGYSQEAVFDGAYIYYIRDNKISLYDKVSHQAQKVPSMGGHGHGVRQIYRSVYFDANLLTISDRELQIYEIASQKQQASLNLTRPQCFAQAPPFWTQVVY